MKLITGALLLLIAELAYAHTHLMQFPHHEAARVVLIPASVISASLGSLFLLWGILAELISSSRKNSEVPVTEKV
ncbi:MAG: hypothetical protein HUJ26_10775 [Planctomycetaceae bacterium]|nr:hypothetical protein [Planctomycetaceae bacterium]